MRFLLVCFVVCGLASAGDALISKPVGGAKSLVLTPELVFGAEDDDETLWGSASTMVDVDARGVIYVCDTMERRVLAFDQEGKFLRLIARAGEGPGELLEPVAFRIFEDGSAGTVEKAGGGIMVRQQRFDTSMTYKSETEAHMIMEAPVLSPLGDRLTAFFVEHDRKAKVTRYRTALLDADLQVLRMFSDHSGPLPDRSKLMSGAYWSKRLADNLARSYKGYGVFNFDQQGRLYSAGTAEYKITRWDKTGQKAEQTFERKYKPIAFNDDQLDAYVESLLEQIMEDPDLAELITPAIIEKAVRDSQPPAAKNPVFGMVVMEDGHLLVVHNVDLIDRTNTADIFGSDGTYKGQIQLPDFALLRPFAGLYLPRMIFRGGKAYTVQTDEDGDNRVIRYGVSWK